MKTEKLSSIVLYVALGITLLLFSIFYFGGMDSTRDDFDKTSLLLCWMYLIAGLCLVVTCIFFCIKFGQTFRRNPRTFWRNFIVFFSILILFFVTWFLGSNEPIQSLEYTKTESYSFWLKLSDMFLYALYVLLGLTILAAPGMSVFKSLKK